MTHGTPSFTPEDKDFLVPEKPLDPADVVTALNEGRLEVYVEFQRQAYDRANQDPSPQRDVKLLIEFAKVCHAARDKLTEYGPRIPLWQRHLDLAYQDAYERRDGDALGNIIKLIQEFGGRVPLKEDLDATEQEEK